MKMLRKNSRWQIVSRTYGYARKRNDRAYEKKQWRKEQVGAIIKL